MFTPPDKRAVVIIGTLVVLGVVNMAIPSESALAVPMERALYFAVVAAGLALAALDIREGCSLNRPSITRDETPLSFWVEVAVSLGFAVAGALKLWRG